MVTQVSCPLLDIPTELLVRILSNLSCNDLCLLQGTCRRFKDTITGTPYLEYLLHTGIDNVDDLLPPDVPFPERVELLKHHERSWSGLRFNLFSEFSTHDNTRDNVARYTLQNGYLIRSDSIPLGQGLKYKYIDLYSLSSGEETNWVPIRLRVIRPRNIVFAADHNLAVAITQQGVGANSRYKLHFFEFTTGEPHPHALMPVVEVPPTHPSLVGFSQAEVLGDYILTVLGSPQHSSLISLVSWKTGVVTHLRNCMGAGLSDWIVRSEHVVINPDLIAQLVSGDDSDKGLEICELEYDLVQLQTVCFLRLPQFPRPVDAIPKISFIKEWVQTSEHHAAESQPASLERHGHVPFRSSSLGTINILLDYVAPTSKRAEGDSRRYVMIISVAAINSAILSGGRREVPWEDWGPAGTHIFPLEEGATLPMPAGPFWITNFLPLEVRDYDSLRMQYLRSTKEDSSSSSSSRSVYSPTRLAAELGEGDEIETHLPYRSFTAKEPKLGNFDKAVADREWIVTISSVDSTTDYTVYRVG